VQELLERFDLDPSETYLSLSGGYALNCPTNSHLMNKFGFKGLLIPPCANDGGQSLGTALYAFHKKTDGIFYFKLESPYYGDQSSEDELSDIIQRPENAPFIESVSELNLEQVVTDLHQQPIVWFNGRAEIGPRALGNRSILGDPRNPETKTILNEIKQRQWWRPVAPMVLEEKVQGWFEEARPSPFMLETFKIHDSKLQLIPAVAHLDGSARIQTVNLYQNPIIHELIEMFESNTGVPMLCNTSLNDKGEPIIDRIEEAINFCLRKQIKIAYINQRRVQFKNFEQYILKEPLPRPDASFFALDELEAARRLAELNPHCLDQETLQTYAFNYYLRSRYDIKTVKGSQLVTRLVKRISNHISTYISTL